MKTRAIVLVLSGIFLLCASVLADVPDEITYQGRLLYNGNPVTSAMSITFRLYQTSSGGSAVWTETHASVTPDSDGIYSVVLGSTVGIPDIYDNLWLALEVAGNVLTPRRKITSAPFVLRAGELSDLMVASKVGIGTTSPVFDVDLWKSAAGGVTQRIRNDNVNGLAQLDLFVNGNGTGDPRIQFDISGEIAYSLGVDNDDSNKFKFSAGAGLGGSDALTIQSNGYVGIGTTSPNDKLSIAGGYLAFPATDGTTPKIGAEASSWGNLNLITDASRLVEINYSAPGGAKLTDLFRVYDGTTAEVFEIDVNGNVGIGTSAPDGLLEVGDVSSTFGGMIIKRLSVTSGAATAFLTLPDINDWAGIVESTAVCSVDRNRHTYELARFAYDRQFYSLLEGNQNSDTTFSASGNNMMVTIGGTPSLNYRLVIRIMGAPES